MTNQNQTVSFDANILAASSLVLTCFLIASFVMSLWR